jgi:hypothetical protein
MSFGESIFSTGFIQKTIKVDLDVRSNHTYQQQKQLQKVREDTRGQTTEEDRDRQTGGTTGRLASPWVRHVSPFSLRQFPTVSSVASLPFLKSV